MDLTDLTGQTGEWLRGEGPESDIVISSRVRLARNLATHRFVPSADPAQRQEVAAEVSSAIERAAFDDVAYVSLTERPRLDRLLLLERHLISKELATGDGPRGVAFNSGEMRSIMVNEEDHIRIQALRSGLQTDAAWADVNEVDSRLEGLVPFAFEAGYGYLTACPTNVGTGMRVSVMLHLPALVALKQIDKVFQAVAKMNLAVRGLYGEGTQAHGDFYQISNQVTLGKSEAEILADVNRVVPQIVRYERRARDLWADEDLRGLEDRVWRASGLLRSARKISSDETMDLLSAVRMGVNLGILPSPSVAAINELFIQIQPAHLQLREGAELSDDERDAARAELIRETLGTA
jgi:protein arginine kinase